MRAGVPQSYHALLYNILFILMRLLPASLRMPSILYFINFKISYIGF